MDKSDSFLVELIRYNNWANAQVFALCQKVDPQHLRATGTGSYGPIIATIGHIVWAEADYVNRLTGSGPQPPAHLQEQGTFAELIAFSEVVAAALLDAAQRIPLDDIVHEEEDGNTIEYKARLLFLQAIHHGIEHRTNITTILNGLGVAIPEVDGWGYLFAHPERLALEEGSRNGPDSEY